MIMEKLNFKEALGFLKNGVPIKRKEWDGYWKLEGNNKVVIHLKEGNDIDLLDTDDVLFTLSHTVENDWEVATLENCKRLQEDKE